MSPTRKQVRAPASRSAARTLDDATLIATVGAESFTKSFGAQNTPDNIAKHFAKAFGVEIQQRELTNPAINI